MPKFAFRCSYLGCIWYTVFTDAGESFRLELRHRLDPYERGLLNYPDEATKDRMVTATIGMLFRENQPFEPIAADLVRAFNEWREAQWQAAMAKMRDDPTRYGVIEDGDPPISRPSPAGAVHLTPPFRGIDYPYRWVRDVEPLLVTLKEFPEQSHGSHRFAVERINAAGPRICSWHGSRADAGREIDIHYRLAAQLAEITPPGKGGLTHVHPYR